MKDRLSIHIDNGQSGIREAVTVLRNGGQSQQPGLVGITNFVYNEGQDPFIPATILNVHSTGNSSVRFSSGPSRFYRSSIELLGNGNIRSSGLHICYNPELDNALVYSGQYGESESIGVDPGATDNSVVDFSLIRPSGCDGLEFSHISMSERGFVSIGLTRIGSQRLVDANAPLTIGYVSNNVTDSGTISMLQQADSPEVNDSFGKIYVKPFTSDGRTQALFFKDDGGTETNLVLGDELDPQESEDGLIFGHNGNTYGGWYTPEVRIKDSSRFGNTYYGWGAGYYLGENGFPSGNSLIGYRAGSGLATSSSYNTVFGYDSLTGFENCYRNIVLGHNNVVSVSTSPSGMSDSIVIGHSLYSNSLPQNGTLSLGISTPVLFGNLIGQKSISVIDAKFAVVETDNCSTEFYVTEDTVDSRFNSVVDVIDHGVSGSTPAENTLKFHFSNISGSGHTLLTLDPSGLITNTPSYEIPEERRPFAELDGDFRLRGAIRFQDGTSISGLMGSNLLPITAVSGTDLRLIGGTNHITLDYSNLSLAGNIADEIRTDNTFVALQLDGSGSQKVGKLSLQGLAGYISSGIASVSENCNMVLSNVENKSRINTSSMSRSVFIGCDVAYGASGWKHAVIIGSEAGVNATVTNPLLDMDKACVFIGHRAGYDADNLDDIIAIGTNAGKDSDGSSNSVFVGSNAGLNSNNPNSIGIGSHALRSSPSGPKGGVGNLEIVCGIDDNNRLMYNAGDLSNRINIMNVIAGRRDICNIAIGKPRLSPVSPLEVRRDSILHGSNPNSYVQAWYCDNSLVASVDCDGTIRAGAIGHGPLHIEGISDVAIGTGSMGSPTSGVMSIYEDGVDTGNKVFIVNRNPSLSIASGDYVFAARVKNQYRPISVS